MTQRWQFRMAFDSKGNHGWSPRTATSSRRRRRMEARLPLARRTELVCRRTALMAPRQLELVLNDVRFRAMTPTERRAVLRAMARLLLEAGGVATREVSDDNA